MNENKNQSKIKQHCEKYWNHTNKSLNFENSFAIILCTSMELYGIGIDHSMWVFHYTFFTTVIGTYN